MNEYFTIKRTGKSSAWFGKCEICGEWCDSVYQQVRWGNADNPRGRTYLSDGFGHEACLLGVRAKPQPA